MAHEGFSSIILGAGKGTRMKSSLSKVLHEVCGVPMLKIVADLVPGAVVVASEDNASEVQKLLPECRVVLQKERLGTAHATAQAMPFITSEKVFILFGDTPLVRAETLEKMKSSSAEIVILGFNTANLANKYGRLVTRGNEVLQIIEYKDASHELRESPLCNSGIFLLKTEVLRKILPLIGNNNAGGEYYLTDIVGLASQHGHKTHYILCEEGEVLGVNSREDLAVVEALMQQALRKKHMENGVGMQDPSSVYLSLDTAIENDVILEPNVVFGKGVRVARGVRIKAFSYLEGVSIGEGAHIGPFARIRGESTIGAGSKIGNFVEVKNSALDNGVKAGHLAYIGDAKIGEGSNIGAGVVFCNYDGKNKHKTELEPNVFVGSNASLVAPVKLGEGSFVAAGSVITKEVPAGSLAVERSEQKTVQGYAARKK